MSETLLLSGTSGLSFDSAFLSPVSFFCRDLVLYLSCHFSLNGISFLLIIFSRNYPTCFCEKISFLVWLLLNSWMMVGRM